MNITTTQDALAAALARIERVVERRNTIPILGNLRMVMASDALAITATDLDIEAITQCPATGAAGRATLPAGMLADIVRKLPKGADINLSVEGARATIRTGRSRFVLQTLPAEDFPDIAAGTLPHAFSVAAGDLARLIARTEYCISTEETRYYLNGIYMHVEPGEGGAMLVAVATDGHRLARARMPAPQGAEGMPGVIVPRKTVGELSRLAKDASEMAHIEVSAAKIRVTLGGTVLTSKLIDGTFPDYARVIPRDDAATTILSAPRDEVIAAVERVTTICSERGRTVLLELGEGATLRAKDKDGGEAEEGLPFGHEGPDMQIAFNGGYLREVLSRIPGEIAVFGLSAAGSPATIRPSDAGEDHLTVLMPMRY